MESAVSTVTALLALLRHVPVVGLTRDGVVIGVSEAAERVLHVHRGSLMGRAWAELCESPDKVRAYLHQCSRTLAPIPGAFVLSAYGTSRRFRCDGYAAILPDGVARVIVLSHLRPVDERDSFILLGQKIRALNDEILRRQDSERQLAAAQARLSAVLDQMPSGVVIADAPDGRIVFTNRRAREIFQGAWDVDDKSDYPTAFAARHADGRPFETPDFPLVRALSGAVVLGEEMHFDSRDGRELVVRVNASPIQHDRGGIAMAVAAFDDITQEKQLAQSALSARAEAEAASRAKDEFLAMLGHELRNPLAPILTALQLMQLRGAGNERERTIIQRQVEHVVHLVDDLLDVSRITTGKVELKRERVEPSTFIAKAAEIAAPILERRQIRLTVSAPPRGLSIEADPARLAQVFANLLNNAAKYSEPGGHVEVVAGREQQTVVIRVRDAGIGISADMLPHIFGWFVQQPQSLARSEGGLGLGLAIAKSLVELHGGTIAADSAGPGAGSEFTVRLPAAPDRPTTSGPEPATIRSAPARSGLRILAVDDNEDSVELLGDLLRELGHEVCVACDAAAALRVAAEFAPQVALLDIGLPVVDGYELGRLLRQERGLAQLVLVAITGYGQASDRARSKSAGFDAHLVKPIDPMGLDAMVRELATAASARPPARDA